MKTSLACLSKVVVRRFLLMTLLFVTLLGFNSCGNKEPDAMVAPQGMHVLDLSSYGKSFAIFVPDTVAALLTISEQSSGALEIKVGKNFAISIFEQATDINARKTDIKDDEVNKLKSYIAEEPDAIMWESTIAEQNEYHFIVNRKIGSSDYSFEDIRDPEAAPFGKEAIQKMFNCCKDIKEIKKQPKS